MQRDEMLIEIEMAEAELRRLGLGDVVVSVRGGDGCAWLQAPGNDIAALVRDPLRSEVLRAVRGAGFDHVAVSLDSGVTS